MTDAHPDLNPYQFTMASQGPNPQLGGNASLDYPDHVRREQRRHPHTPNEFGTVVGWSGTLTKRKPTLSDRRVNFAADQVSDAAMSSGGEGYDTWGRPKSGRPLTDAEKGYKSK